MTKVITVVDLVISLSAVVYTGEWTYRIHRYNYSMVFGFGVHRQLWIITPLKTPKQYKTLIKPRIIFNSQFSKRSMNWWHTLGKRNSDALHSWSKLSSFQSYFFLLIDIFKQNVLSFKTPMSSNISEND